MKKPIEDVVYDLIKFIQEDILGEGFIPDCFGDFSENECTECKDYHNCKSEIAKRERLKEMISGMNGLTVYFDGDGTWYASPWDLEKTRQWAIQECHLDNDLELEECNIEKDGMWYETNDKKDIEELGSYDESCKGGLGDLRRGIEDKRIVEKLTSFKEVLTIQGVSKLPYIIATTNY